MGKEEKERKPRKARDIESEYPKWPWVDYKSQYAKFFEEVRKLLVNGLDPKGEITDKYVTSTDIAGIFGNVHKFNITNPLLIKEQRKQLEKLYWKIYGISHITNNELHLWMIKGWIAENKGNVVNWTEAAIGTAQEKAQCVS
jgi:hypothetical protein